MANLESEILEYHNLAADLAELHVKVSNLGKIIVDKYCKYKVGQHVLYKESHSSKDRHGIIERVYFQGISNSAINNKWVVYIAPSNNKGVPIKGRSWVKLGTDERDFLRILENNL